MSVGEGGSDAPEALNRAVQAIWDRKAAHTAFLDLARARPSEHPERIEYAPEDDAGARLSWTSFTAIPPVLAARLRPTATGRAVRA